MSVLIGSSEWNDLKDDVEREKKYRHLDPTGKFAPYFGNHHKSLPNPEIRRGGGVSFRWHLAEPLTERLWQDVTERLCARKLLVYTWNCGQWTIGWGSGTCIIRLAEDGTVHDIEWTP